MKEQIQKLSKLIIPDKCIDCSAIINESYNICSECFKKYEFINENICQICGILNDVYEQEDQYICMNCTLYKPIYSKSRSLFKFDDHSKKLIHKFKYYDHTNISKFIAKLFISRFKYLLHEVDIITCVPMHKFKRIYRLYNQSQILAKEISNISKQKFPNIEFVPELLFKIKYTKSQTMLTLKERENNIKDSIIKNPKIDINGKTILLVDDVITTGNTINTCSKILKNEGANCVNIFSAARNY